jgi:hypothetical protein
MAIAKSVRPRLFSIGDQRRGSMARSKPLPTAG